MKLKKDEMTRLSPRAVADYLQSHGWRHDQDVENKGAIWLYHDDQGDEYEIMLPTNREVGDFAIRMSEAIRTLGEVEERSTREVFSTLAEINTLPWEIFEGEVAAEEDLEWNAAEKAKLEPLMEALKDRVAAGAHEVVLFVLAEIAETLAHGTALIGDHTSKKSAVWRSCERVLLGAGWPANDNVSSAEFWDAARASRAETWFCQNFPVGDEVGEKKPGTPVSHDPESQRT